MAFMVALDSRTIKAEIHNISQAVDKRNFC